MSLSSNFKRLPGNCNRIFLLRVRLFRSMGVANVLNAALFPRSLALMANEKRFLSRYFFNSTLVFSSVSNLEKLIL